MSKSPCTAGMRIGTKKSWSNVIGKSKSGSNTKLTDAVIRSAKIHKLNRKSHALCRTCTEPSENMNIDRRSIINNIGSMSVYIRENVKSYDDPRPAFGCAAAISAMLLALCD